MHLSQSTQYVNYGTLNKIDIAIVEGLAITEEGHIIPTTAVGNAPSFIKNADKVIVEINLKKPMSLEGMADIVDKYLFTFRPYRHTVHGMWIR